MLQPHHHLRSLLGLLALSLFTSCTGGTSDADLKAAASSPLAAEVSIFGASVTPTTLADPDTASVELGVKFRSSVPGTVAGIRFYKGSSANSGTHVGSLWSRSGQRLASATFTNETATGWQTVRFATPVSISANTTYVASYLSPRGRYSATGNAFASQGTTNGPLTALASGVDGENGVYLYGSGGFPTQSYQSTNYFVDVLFTSTADTSAPTAPGALAAAASTAGAIQLTWTAATDNIGVTAYVIFRGGTEVTSVSGGTLGYKDIGLTPSTLYSYSVRARDAAGNLGPASNTASATTSSEPPPPGLSLPRVPWEGGPSYYARFPAMAGTPWTSEDFFPIGYWGAYSEAEWRFSTDAAHGINTFLETYNVNESSAGWMRQYGIWNLAGNGLGGEAVGASFDDETDMWGGPGWNPWTGYINHPEHDTCVPDQPRRCGFTVYNTLYERLNNPNALIYANVGKGALMWESDDERATFLCGADGPDPRAKWRLGVATGDIYFYTDENIGAEAVTWFGIPAGEVRRAANYGEVLMTGLRSGASYGNNGVPRIPLGVVVELGGQATGRLINANQVEGAVWSTLIHEARIVAYFSHVFSNTTANPSTSDVLNDTRPAYQATRDRVKKLNAEVKSLARVLNTQSYVWQFNPNLSTMLKYRDNAAYVFAMQKRQFASGTYTFTLPPELPASGTIEVIGENRSIPYSGGRFTDSFAAEYTHHNYRIPD
ncbi:DUF4082 domain-containing protein [Pyxidicoccus xibeiensis]|uniref:DUF4082 domain-containing protein n=1 Tax=Pyxidicoccus xibeiensis TaxID=2906759 RepID=UPI0020A7663A|nr:DUF4082 domain-containing protein [Pyxidicoccus xibeiensis]MCP3138209.1 DUF4082 domain-containing protein [Pyxidicoccus xibeiensis]